MIDKDIKEGVRKALEDDHVYTENAVDTRERFVAGDISIHLQFLLIHLF